MLKLRRTGRKLFLLLFYRNDVQLLTAPGKRDRNYFILQAMTGNAFMSLVGGVFLSGLYIHVGAPDSIMGYVPIIGSISGIILIFGGLIIERQKSRKSLVLTLNILAKTIIVSVVWVPLIVERSVAPFVMLGLTFTGFALNALMSLAISSWFVDAIDESIRGRFMGVQHIFALLISATFPILGGRYLDVAPDRYVAFCIIYSVAWIFMLMESFSFSRIHEPPFSRAPKGTLKIRDVFVKPLKNKEFLRLTATMMFFNFVWFVAFSFVALYEIRYLGISFTFLTAAGIINPILQMVWYPMVGRLLDRYGAAFLVRTAFLLYAIHAMVYFFLTSETYPIILILLNINASFIGPIITLGIFNMRFKIIPKDGRTIYEGFYVSIIGIIILLAPFFGYLVKGFLETRMEFLSFLPHYQFRMMFLGTGLLVLALYLYEMAKVKKQTDWAEEKQLLRSLCKKRRTRHDKTELS